MPELLVVRKRKVNAANLVSQTVKGSLSIYQRYRSSAEGHSQSLPPFIIPFWFFGVSPTNPLFSRHYNPRMDWIPRDRPLAAHWNESAGVFLDERKLFRGIRLAIRWVALSFGDMPVLNITHWMPLPELPQGSVVV